MTKIELMLDGCRLYPAEAWVSVLERLAKGEGASHRSSYSTPIRAFRETLRIQQKTTADANIENWGFEELLLRLNMLPDEMGVDIDEFGIDLYIVRGVFLRPSNGFLGCTIVKKKEGRLRTPPNWDGSLEALERFNQSGETK
jgi:hypothetical protein